MIFWPLPHLGDQVVALNDTGWRADHDTIVRNVAADYAIGADRAMLADRGTRQDDGMLYNLQSSPMVTGRTFNGCCSMGVSMSS